MEPVMKLAKGLDAVRNNMAGVMMRMSSSAKMAQVDANSGS